MIPRNRLRAVALIALGLAGCTRYGTRTWFEPRQSRQVLQQASRDLECAVKDLEYSPIAISPMYSGRQYNAVCVAGCGKSIHYRHLDSDAAWVVQSPVRSGGC